jgi:hypothetical protein
MISMFSKCLTSQINRAKPKGKDYIIITIQSQPNRHRLQLYVESYPCELLVCISRFFVLNKCPEMYYEKPLFSLLKIEMIKVCIFSVWFRKVAWPLSYYLKPWSYNMCACCRDPKTQNGVGDYLCADGHLEVRMII